MAYNKSKARKLAEFLRNITDDAKIETSAVEQDTVVTSRVDLESKANDTESLVTPAAVTSYVSDKLDDYVLSTHDINLTFTGDVTGQGTITDMGHTSFALTLDAETLPVQTGYAGKFLTTDGTTASWATVDTSNGDTAYSWGDHSQEGYLTSFTETDPTVPSHVKAITTTDISQWEDAYSWGDHSQEGYLTSETNDYVDSVSFSTSNGVLSLGRTGSLPDLTVDLDGRYLQSYTDTTYNVSAVDVSGGKAVRLTGSDGTTDDVKFAAGSNVSLARSGDTITISSTDTNTDTNTTDWYVANSSGGNQFKVDKNENVRFEGTGATSVSFNASNNKITISSTDTNTENTTNLVDNGDNTITYTNEEGTAQTIDLSLYLDDTNLARILSGTMNSSGVATFTRDDDTTFTVDMSVLLDDTNLSRIVSASWNTSNGVLTLTRNDSSTVAVDLDGRFVQKAGDTMTGNLTIQNNTPSLILVDTESANPTNQSIRIQHDALDANLPGGEGLGLRIDSTDTSGSNLNPAIITSGNIYANNTSKVFHDAYHPNADKWTTARTNTVTLTGDASGSGSASVDGTGNWTVSVPVVVNNDSHTHDGRYVNVTGDTMSGQLIIGTGQANPLELTRSSQVGIEFNDTSVGSRYLGVSGGVLRFGGNLNHGVNDRVFTDAYHPNADKWTTARTNTVTLTGDASGSGSASVDGTGNWTVSVPVSVNNNSHDHTRLLAVDNRDMKPNTSGIQSDVKAIKAFFSSGGGMTSSGNTDYKDVLVLDTYSDSSGGGPNAITFDKGSAVGDPQVHIWKGAWGGTTWGTGQRVFADNYHPNADKWTTARSHTVTLTGDVTGSATQSVDGTGNKTWTVNTTVADNSHDHNYLRDVGTITNLNDAWTTRGTSEDGGLQVFRYQNTATNMPVTGNNANWLMNIYAHAGSSGNYPYGRQFAGTDNQDFYTRSVSNGSFGAWRKVWTTAHFDIANYDTRTISDGRYVRKTGDTMSGQLTVNADTVVTGDLKLNGSDSFIWTPPTASGYTGFWDQANARVAMRYENNIGGWGIMGTPQASTALKVHGNLRVTGDTYLGDGNGDATYVNDILRVRATDSGNSEFWFGEATSNTAHYGSKWYWDSVYTHYWKSVNAGSETDLMWYATNDLTYVNWGRNFHMQNKDINYVNQLHFNDNVRFYDEGNDNYLNFKWGDTGAGGIKFRDGDNLIHGYVYGNGTGQFGLLNGAGEWAVRIENNGLTELRYDGSNKLNTTSTGVNVTGLLTATQKSFTIDHPTKAGYKLRYGSLEGPENGVYVRGRLKNNNVIELPDVWVGLVHEDSITVSLTAIGKSQEIWVEDIVDNKVIVGGENVNCFYHVFAERKDVDKLVTEFKEVE